jgi:uncharacterized protein YaeQ
MALTATIFRFEIALSDVDRGVYETLDLRVAQHPSESARYLLTRTLAYCLTYEEGIAFSKGGISSADEAPIAVRDLTGVLKVWVDVGNPSAERLHKASKAAERVLVFTHHDPELLRREVRGKSIHKAEEIELYAVPASLLDALEGHLARNTKLELTRNDGHLYVTAGGKTFDAPLVRHALVDPE